MQMRMGIHSGEEKKHFELNELLLWFRVLRWRGRWLEDATFLSFWRHGATMPSFDVLLLLIFVQVNIAALMESTSEPMKIQISQTTQEISNLKARLTKKHSVNFFAGTAAGVGRIQDGDPRSNASAQDWPGILFSYLFCSFMSFLAGDNILAS